MQALNGTTNGAMVPAAPGGVKKVLTGKPLTLGYRDRGADYWPSSSARRPPYWQVLRDVEVMRADVESAFSIYKAGIAHLKVTAAASSPDVAAWAVEEWGRFFGRHRDLVQTASYEYGHAGFEPTYRDRDGRLSLDDLLPLGHRDARPLSYGHEYVGVEVQNVPDRPPVRLWGGCWQPYPPKAFWAVHRRKFDRWYGQSQYYPAWRDWKRLCGRDGAQEVTDAAVYRFGVAGVEVGYPPSEFSSEDGTVDDKAASTQALQLAENYKNGAAIALPTTQYPDKGGPQWTLKTPESVLDTGPLLEYCLSLEKAIALKIGVLPEVMEAAETGSGYSGRVIPLQVYMTTQQSNADEMVSQWQEQIGLPLARWNFGAGAWFELACENLFKTWQAEYGGGGQSQGGQAHGPGGRFAPKPQQQMPQPAA